MRGSDEGEVSFNTFGFYERRIKCSRHDGFEKFIERPREWFFIQEIALDYWGAVQNLEGMGFTVFFSSRALSTYCRSP